MDLKKISPLILGEKQGRPHCRRHFRNWKNLGKALLLFFMLLWGSACGLFPQEDLKGWVGFHREELIRVMGPPSKETPLPDGSTQLDFITRITKHPSAAQQYGTSYVCHRTFIIDSKGFVSDAWKEGC